ncbi:MAG: patatin-like phospholipase family protein [Eggerthellaceae bacterium]|jgi:predicted patatin/cPLA2 family phospholipase|nr:patatin-like phospholipase family protein [Eggerthellaceae bacterium]MDR2715435.1 patatin-like phospholipase family protein [Coriobacteriaceae bacterium]
MEPLSNNVKDVALIFEGGGLRNSYSSALVNVLLENGIYFDAVYGLSAGASNAINYLSRDAERSRLTFTEHADDLPFRKSQLFLLENNILASPSIQHYGPAESKAPFDFESFQANPAQLTFEGIDRNTGKTVYWTQRDFTTEEKLMERVQATLSYPIVMPPMRLVGDTDGAYYDGGPGEGGGIMLPRAQKDGFSKFFVVCTQHKGFRKRVGHRRLFEAFFWRRPQMREAVSTWAQRYNEQLDRLAELERAGAACVFYAHDQSAIRREVNMVKLKNNFEIGCRQARSEVGKWVDFLGL